MRITPSNFTFVCDSMYSILVLVRRASALLARNRDGYNDIFRLLVGFSQVVFNSVLTIAFNIFNFPKLASFEDF